MDNPLLFTISVFCIAPLILFWAGVAVGRWSTRIRVVKVDRYVRADNATLRRLPDQGIGGSTHTREKT